MKPIDHHHAGGRRLPQPNKTMRMSEFAVLTNAELSRLSQTPTAAVETVEMELDSLASVRSAAAELVARFPGIDVLINNAGVMFTPFGRTEDGFELQLGVNHLGHFELTRGVMPSLLNTGSARVVNLSSDGHHIFDLDLEDPNWERQPYDKFKAYGSAKTANVLFTVALDARYRDSGVRSFAVHPGTVATSLSRHMSRDDMKAMMGLGTASSEPAAEPPRLEVISAEEGAATSVWASVSDDLTGLGGLYLKKCAVSDGAMPYATDPRRAEQLWMISEQLCGS
ncbi:SDR family NAD(P)-dependent oxidoreductase [Mycobacterium sp. AZCC_0083]|uniref:SDR family NAD(P)-dependent oxidoreductase n=1 Tax=Mycobacterium sp. AZCC_0083 TaxID=2735882 RepID=UPI001613F085|nr:SDR family NAD(P)-dependent oxidoreductase [Mycobacterium sp. AZCC_0083]MBB5165341.1 NAD(P)-dependent dehydrogenase (short-subunit alcohol dehydrogenase family) [Mycobacterium sp. AZCC_0083]